MEPAAVVPTPQPTFSICGIEVPATSIPVEDRCSQLTENGECNECYVPRLGTFIRISTRETPDETHKETETQQSETQEREEPKKQNPEEDPPGPIEPATPEAPAAGTVPRPHGAAQISHDPETGGIMCRDLQIVIPVASGKGIQVRIRGNLAAIDRGVGAGPIPIDFQVTVQPEQESISDTGAEQEHASSSNTDPCEPQEQIGTENPPRQHEQDAGAITYWSVRVSHNPLCEWRYSIGDPSDAQADAAPGDEHGTPPPRYEGRET
ncbi:hypothetical protein K402DRAFT_450367 [Aulographum hederae CBS 113979]|uniref:Uncharacterized protein n=1 Tax=Aulographum hederae CBS 113979 TaxID=1176131 RepID=A0A6G1HEF2_9PEZI|nr:hypothetical protein K402DRAFT_450367 [Aulographum hederae CBS 113979]